MIDAHCFVGTLQVVFGIIVDTFSELRDEKQQISEAMNSECFICSRKAYEFDRYGTPFADHVKDEHHQWNYLYYMLYLEDLDHTDYDSNQQYFADALASEAEATVFPINKARCLAKMEDEAEDTASTNAKILEQLTALLTKVDRLEKNAAEKASSKKASMSASKRAQAPVVAIPEGGELDFDGFEEPDGRPRLETKRSVSGEDDL